MNDSFLADLEELSDNEANIVSGCINRFFLATLFRLIHLKLPFFFLLNDDCCLLDSLCDRMMKGRNLITWKKMLTGS